MTDENICIVHFIKKILSGVTIPLYHEFLRNNTCKFSPSFKENPCVTKKDHVMPFGKIMDIYSRHIDIEYINKQDLHFRYFKC
jgi:hypothetical protein